MLEPFWRSLILLSNLVIRGGYVAWNPASVVSLGCYSPFDIREASTGNTGGHSVGFENCVACNTAFAILRGNQCICISSEDFAGLIRVEDAFCDIQCNNPGFMCGGNLGSNLYCNKFVNETLCQLKSEENVPPKTIYRSFDEPDNSFPTVEPCLNLGCRQPPPMYPTANYYEYFPNLNPEDCVIYCTYKSAAYAHVGWLPIGKGFDFSPMCICSNSTTPADEAATTCQVGNCPEPLNPVVPSDKNDDYEPSCGNKDDITPQYSVYCTTKAVHNANDESYCIEISSSPPPGGWCSAEVLTTHEPKASSFTSQPSTAPPEKCPDRRVKHERDDPGLEVLCDNGNCEPPACSFNGSCYYFYELVNAPEDVDVLRNISADDCAKKNGHLLAIETNDEQTFILSTFFDVMSQTYEPFLTSGIKESANTQAYWSYCDVKMPMETSNGWMLPIYHEGNSYPAFLIIDVSAGNATMEFTRCEVGRFYFCEHPEPFVVETSTSPATTTSTEVKTEATEATTAVKTTQATQPTETTQASQATETDKSTTGIVTAKTTMKAPPGTTDVPVVNADGCPCKSVDHYGDVWIVSANKTKVKECRPGATGTASWTCIYTQDAGCQLATDQPDYSNCHSLELDSIADNVANNATKLEDVWYELYNFTEADDKYFGHEISTILQLVTQILDRQDWEMHDAMDHLEFQLNSTSTGAEIVNNLLSHDVQWYQINQYNRSASALELLSVSEDIAFRLVAVAEKEERSLRCENILDNITISSLFWDGAQSSIDGCQLNQSSLIYTDLLLRFPSTGTGSFIRLPQSVLQSGRPHKAAGVFISHYLIELLLPGGNNAMEMGHKQVNSPLISYSIGNRKESYVLPTGSYLDLVLEHVATAKDPPVRTLRRSLDPGEVPSAVIGSAFCSFLSIADLPSKGEYWTWDNAGCQVFSSNRTHTVCHCNHLTGFSNLMDFHNYIGEVLALDITSIVCSTSSVISLAITFAIFTLLKVIKTDRTVITQNLCISLMLSHFMALTTLDRHYLHLDDAACATMGILLHFTLLVSFMWMGVEGVRLCRMVLYVFNLRDWTRYYLIAAYLIPTIIVTVTVLTAYYTTGILQAYTGDEICWLNGENYKWSFAGPISVIIMINLVFIAIALYSSWNLKQNAERSFNEKFKNAVAMCLSLTCLLGISWLSGFLLYAEAIVFAYIFTITNGLQGLMMFIFRCVLNEEVRTALNDRWKRKRSRRQLGAWSSVTTTKGTSSHIRHHSSVISAGRTLPRLYQTMSTLSVQSDATKVTDVSILRPVEEVVVGRRQQTVRTVSGTEYFEDSLEHGSISGGSEFSFRAGSSTSWGSPRRVAFVDSPDATIHETIESSHHHPSTNHSHQMILVNRKTDMMPFTDLDPMMFF